MKVILLQTIKGIGTADSVVEVKDGYGKNYLIKNKLAIPYTDANSVFYKKRLANQKASHEAEIARFLETKKLIENTKLLFNLKTSSNKTFGTITHHQIIDELKKLHIKITKFDFDTDKKFFGFGTHKIKLQLHKDVVAFLHVDVVAVEQK